MAALACAAALALAAATEAHPVAPAPTVTLGSAKFYGRISKGFGTVRPSKIFNGGDPSGLVTKIVWTSWGGATASGHGLNAIFMPKGGYYSELVTIDLKPQDRGTCPGSSQLVYRQLLMREPSKPGGPVGKWILWAGARNLCASAP